MTGKALRKLKKKNIFCLKRKKNIFKNCWFLKRVTFKNINQNTMKTISVNSRFLYRRTLGQLFFRTTIWKKKSLENLLFLFLRMLVKYFWKIHIFCQEDLDFFFKSENLCNEAVDTTDKRLDFKQKSLKVSSNLPFRYHYHWEPNPPIIV